MEINQKAAEEEDRYKKEMEKIEAGEKKHNREWDEDWGAKDRPKSPKSPSPAPPETKNAKSKSSPDEASSLTEEDNEEEQKGEKKKKKKKVSNTDTLQELRKNKKEMEFELKLAKEKEEMHEREKQLKINRLVQESFKFWFYLKVTTMSLTQQRCYILTLPQVSETEREDLEESEKVQHWVERLCQTRLEQISCVENESPELSPPRSPAAAPRVKRFPGGLHLATTDLDDINLDDVDQSLRGPLKRLAPTQPSTSYPPPPLPLPPPLPKLNPQYTTTPIRPLEHPHSDALPPQPAPENLPLLRLLYPTKDEGLTHNLCLPNTLARLPPNILSRRGLRPPHSRLHGLTPRPPLLHLHPRLPLRRHHHNTQEIEWEPSAGTGSINITTNTINTPPVLRGKGVSGSQAAISQEGGCTRPTPVRCPTPPVQRLETLM
ncbi:hypothetical protein F7725_022635 [Dissostichus mawsoni]|uniref:Uncharacterized protein n=1 Tax=Dissostichus mawsoni TaxID=36200 RepID=A0A7J5YYP4_DISMA|nr:hypothetical protein F7725_022635 [Dissostichus mawsoni]